MLNKILTGLLMVYAAASFAAVDANQANAAELDSIKGIGPAMSSRILEERKKGNFKDWPDFIGRIKGVGESTATRFSKEGLTINGAEFKSMSATRAEPAKPAASAARK